VPRRKNEPPRKIRNYTRAELQAIYAQAQREFTAADLQKYTVIEKGIPAEKVLAAMEKIHRRYANEKR
jgi:hypothetical protein